MDIHRLSGNTQQQQRDRTGAKDSQANSEHRKRKLNRQRSNRLLVEDAAFIDSATQDPHIASMLKALIINDRNTGFLTPQQEPSLEYLILTLSRLRQSETSLPEWENALAEVIRNLGGEHKTLNIDLNA